VESTVVPRALVTPTSRARLTRVQRVRVATEIVGTYAKVRWWLMRLEFRDAVAAARHVDPRAAATTDPTASAIRLGRTVGRTLAALPFDGKCLVRSLVLTHMLSRRGIESRLVLGVRARPTFLAHAWLERDGTALLPTGPEFERIAEL
jgi:hypothetical protein